EQLDKANGGGLSGFGGKMILGMSAGRAAGDVLGDRHGGQEIGSAISGFVFGGPMLGSAVVAMDLIGEAFRKNRELALEATKATTEYADAARDLGKAWAELATSQTRGDSFEKSLQGLRDSSRANHAKAADELNKIIDEGPSIWDGGSS